MSADSIASINMKNIKAFAETFLANPNKHMEWLANSGNGTRFSRTLFLLVVLQTLVPSEGTLIFAVTFLIFIYHCGSSYDSCNNKSVLYY